MSDITIEQPWVRAGITYRQYDHWTSQGWIEGGNPGNGYYREMNREQYKVLSQMAKLVRNGVKPSFAHKHVMAGKAEAIIKAMESDA